jgi:hypothetical protein
MRKGFAHRLPKTKFVVLQVVAWGLAVIPAQFEPGEHAFLLLALLFHVGVLMGIVGLVWCARNGQGLGRLLGSTISALLASTGFWLVCLLTMANPWSLSHYGEPMLYLPLPFFSTGSLAYFGLGPFRWRVSPSQVVRQLIVGNRDLRIGGPGRVELVAKAERLLGLSLPTPFRDFLLDYGEIRGTAVTLLGLGPATDLDHPTTDDFVGATLDARTRLSLPRGYALCSVDAEGGLMACLDTTAIETEIPVVLWNPATRSVVRVAAPSFPVYLINSLRSTARNLPR